MEEKQTKHELPPEMVIKKGGPHGEDIVLPLKYIDGVPTYIKEVELPHEELFGRRREKVVKLSCWTTFLNFFLPDWEGRKGRCGVTVKNAFTKLWKW